jgi:hypothetical protein
MSRQLAAGLRATEDGGREVGATTRPASDDVDHAPHRRAAVERRLRPLHDLDAVDRRERDAGEVERAGHAPGHRLPVEEDEHPRTAESLQGDAMAGGHAGVELHAGEAAQQRAEVRDGRPRDLAARDHFGGDDGVSEALLAS